MGKQNDSRKVKRSDHRVAVKECWYEGMSGLQLTNALAVKVFPHGTPSQDKKRAH